MTGMSRHLEKAHEKIAELQTLVNQAEQIVAAQFKAMRHILSCPNRSTCSFCIQMAQVAHDDHVEEAAPMPGPPPLRVVERPPPLMPALGRIIADNRVEPGTIELRGEDGKLLGKITDVEIPGDEPNADVLAPLRSPAADPKNFLPPNLEAVAGAAFLARVVDVPDDGPVTPTRIAADMPPMNDDDTDPGFRHMALHTSDIGGEGGED